MASSSVYNALKNYVQAQFAGVYPVLDADDIEPAIEQGDAPFLALEELPGDEQLSAFGNSDELCMRETGVLLIHGFVPSPESSSTARSIVDSVRDTMRHKTIDGIRITATTPPDQELMNEGLWGASVTAVSYEADFKYDRGA